MTQSWKGPRASWHLVHSVTISCAQKLTTGYEKKLTFALNSADGLHGVGFGIAFTELYDVNRWKLRKRYGSTHIDAVLRKDMD